MKKLELYQMENVEGGKINWNTWVCSAGISTIFAVAAAGCGTPVTWIAGGAALLGSLACAALWD